MDCELAVSQQGINLLAPVEDGVCIFLDGRSACLGGREGLADERDRPPYTLDNLKEDAAYTVIGRIGIQPDRGCFIEEVHERTVRDRDSSCVEGYSGLWVPLDQCHLTGFLLHQRGQRLGTKPRK